MNTIFPDYNLDWALTISMVAQVDLIDCPTQDCWITADDNDYSLAWLGHDNQSNFHYQTFNHRLTTLYANHNTSIRFAFGEDGNNGIQ